MSIKFHLPDFWSHGPLNLALIDMIKEHPEYFRDGVEIASVYGCFPPLYGTAEEISTAMPMSVPLPTFSMNSTREVSPAALPSPIPCSLRSI